VQKHLTQGGYNTYSVTMWEKVGESGNLYNANP